jgi:hypothetical protein
MKYLFAMVTVLWLVSSAEAQSVMGVWKAAEVVISGGPNAGRHTTDVQPGLLIITNKHYAMLFVGGFKPRPRLSEKPTDEERGRAYEPFTANAGTYELKGTTMTYTPVVAQNPASMEGKPRSLEIRLEADSLSFITKSPEGIETRSKYVLVERLASN